MGRVKSSARAQVNHAAARGPGGERTSALRRVRAKTKQSLIFLRDASDYQTMARRHRAPASKESESRWLDYLMSD
jgi:hypothetical protein